MDEGTTAAVVIATTEGLTSATTSAILGSSAVWLDDGGGVQPGLIGVVGVDGVVVGGVSGVSGVVMVIQPGNAPSASEMTRINIINRVFRFILFMTIYILAYQHIIKIMLKKSQSPLLHTERGLLWAVAIRVI